MDLAEFNRTFHIRAPNIMWFLGSGASAAGNIPTAGYMIWDFKRRLYCTAQRIPLSTCADLSDPVLRNRLQIYFDGLGRYPPSGSDDEYAAFFEAAYPDDGDRRRYIEQLVAGGKPSYGHEALAALVQLEKIRVLWTTNFDKLVEDALFPVLGSTGKLVVSTTDNAAAARETLNEASLPLLVKLHGDFHSRRLKNTNAELREQDRNLRDTLVHAGGRFGLAIVGYSGRDGSVLDALEAVLDEPAPFPSGLFWFYRAGEPPHNRVRHFVDTAAAKNVDSHLIEVETFDELFGDLMLLVESVPEALRNRLDRRNARLGDAPVPAGGDSFPVIRTNAIPVLSAPALCRRIVCKIGNTREVRMAVREAKVDVLVARRRTGVLAFGRDTDIRAAFATNAISEFDLQSLDVRRMIFPDSAEMGLLLEALAHAIERERPLRAERRKSRFMLVADKSSTTDHALLSPLEAATKGLTGVIPGTDLKWCEAAWLRLERRLNQLWLFLEPTVWLERTTNDAQFESGRDFTRERQARRMNSQANTILEAWVDVVVGGAETATLSAYGITENEGVDACFKIGRVTAYSRRLTGSSILRPVLGRSQAPATSANHGR